MCITLGARSKIDVLNSFQTPGIILYTYGMLAAYNSMIVDGILFIYLQLSDFATNFIIILPSVVFK